MINSLSFSVQIYSEFNRNIIYYNKLAGQCINGADYKECRCWTNLERNLYFFIYNFAFTISLLLLFYYCLSREVTFYKQEYAQKIIKPKADVISTLVTIFYTRILFSKRDLNDELHYLRTKIKAIFFKDSGLKYGGL